MRVRVSRYYCNSACSAAATIDTGLDTGHGANTMDGLLHWAWYRRCAALRLRLQHLFPRPTLLLGQQRDLYSHHSRTLNCVSRGSCGSLFHGVWVAESRAACEVTIGVGANGGRCVSVGRPRRMLTPVSCKTQAKESNSLAVSSNPIRTLSSRERQQRTSKE